MRVVTLAIVLGLGSSAMRAADLSAKAAARIQEATTVLKEIHTVPDKDIPQNLWVKAQCVLVVPGMKKAAFVFGGEYGAGVMSCRQASGWSAPVFMQVEKGSFGLQIGAEAIDLVMLVMNKAGMEKLLRNKTSLGGEASVAGGPVGRDVRAATDAQMKAEILSYSRSQGLFAGLDLSGGVVKPDKDTNADLYGKVAVTDVVLSGTIAPPPATEPFIAALKSR